VRAALRDPDMNVRIAAVRACGMAHDTNAVDQCLHILQTDDTAARREAATTLGKLGDTRAAPALLVAATNATDRFIEHAIIYSLIQLKHPASAIAALQDPSARTRKAALIALDQMEGAPLQKEHLFPELGDFNEDAKKAALWVAAHHPDWADLILQFGAERLIKFDWAPSDANSLRPVLSAFIGNTNVQLMLATILAGRIDPERKAFILDIMDHASLAAFPPTWIHALGMSLTNYDEHVRWQTVNLVRSRGIGEFDAKLQSMAADSAEPAELRVAAFGAVISRQPQIDAPGFNFLLSQLKEPTPATLRLAAAQVLGRAQLNEDQLLQLASETVPKADALILPPLLEPYRKSTYVDVGNALVSALIKSSVNLNQLAGGKLDDLLKNYPAEVHDAAKPLLTKIETERRSRLKRLKELEPLLSGGDVGRGRRVFFGQKAACFGCHAIGSDGGRLGPDLTSIGSIRSGRDLIEAIVFPSASFVPGYEPYRIETSSDLLTGVIGSQTPEAVILKTGANAESHIPRGEIKSMVPGTVSIMPEGLDSALTRDELLDLLAFLQAQNGNEFLQPRKPK
jgi:putative heme-binding domain-containing protein